MSFLFEIGVPAGTVPTGNAGTSGKRRNAVLIQFLAVSVNPQERDFRNARSIKLDPVLRIDFAGFKNLSGGIEPADFRLAFNHVKRE